MNFDGRTEAFWKLCVVGVVVVVVNVVVDVFVVDVLL